MIWKRTLACQMADATGHDRDGAGSAATSSTSAEDTRVRGERHDDHVPGLPAGLRRGQPTTRTPSSTTRRRLLPPLAGRQRAGRASSTPKGHTTHAAGALHRGVARQAPRRARHRPALDVRVDHPDRSRTAATCGRRARRSCRRGPRSPSSTCSSSTSPTSSTTSSPPRWRTTSTPSPPAPAKDQWLQRFYFGDEPTARASSSWSRRTSTQIDAAEINTVPARHSTPTASGSSSSPASTGPYVKRGDDTAACPTTCPRRAHGRQGARAPRSAEGRRADRHDPRRPPGLRQERALRALRAARGRRHAAAGREAEDGLAVQDDDARAASPRRRARAAVACRGRSARTRPTARSRSPTTAGTGPYVRRARTAAASTPRSSCSPISLDEALAAAGAAQGVRRGAEAAPKPPLRELGTDPVSGQARSWPRTAASGRT